MKKIFEHRLVAINWIADNIENEAQFEVLREQLSYNKEWFLEDKWKATYGRNYLVRWLEEIIENKHSLTKFGSVLRMKC